MPKPWSWFASKAIAARRKLFLAVSEACFFQHLDNARNHGTLSLHLRVLSRSEIFLGGENRAVLKRS